MPINYLALGKRIQDERKKKGFTQSQLSELVHCTSSYLSYVENGTKCISLDLLIAIANELNVSADMLLLDSLSNTVDVSNFLLNDIMNNSSEYEKIVLLKALSELKSILNDYRNHIKSRL